MNTEVEPVVDKRGDFYHNRVRQHINTVYLSALYESEQELYHLPRIPSQNRSATGPPTQVEDNRYATPYSYSRGTERLIPPTPSFPGTSQPHGVAGRAFSFATAYGNFAPDSRHQLRLLDRNSHPFETTSIETLPNRYSDTDYIASPSNNTMLSSPPLLCSPAASSTTNTIEVAPGVHLQLRGAAETLRAIEDDFYIPAECSCCNMTLFCIQNADLVLCPDCRVVSPVVVDSIRSSNEGQSVGLGFTMEDLMQCQTEVVTRRVAALSNSSDPCEEQSA